MDQINPFTNAPMPPQQGQPPAAQQTGAQGPVQPAKPAAAAPTPKPKRDIDIKTILKSGVMIIIGLVIAKLAFDSVVPMFQPKPDPKTSRAVPKTSISKKSAVSKTAAGKAKAGKGAESEVSLAEAFAAAKKTPLPAPKQSSEPYVVNGVFLSEGDGISSAIVNNKVVQVGDTVDGAFVQSITIEGVELVKEDETIKLRYR